MKTKKPLMVGGAILLGVVLMGSVAAEAWGHGRWFGRGGGCGGWFHHGPRGGKDMPEFILRHLDEKVNQLNLTADQRTKYNELRTSIKTHLSEAVEDHAAFRESLHAEMAKETPDVSALTEKMKVKIQDVSTVMQKNLDLLSAFYGSLDNNQKKQVVSEIRERMAEHSHREGRLGR